MIKTMTTILLLAAGSMFAGGAVAAGEKPANSSEFTSPGKPGHPLKVNIEWSGKPEVGVSLPMNVNVKSGYEISAVDVSVRPSKGLVLETAGNQYLEKVSAGDEEGFTLSVMPASDGIHRLQVRVRARVGDQVWSREVSVDVPVGVVQQKTTRDVQPAPTVKAADGVLERRAPARQTVTRDNN